MNINDSIVEDATLGWFGELGYSGGQVPHLAPGKPEAERDAFGEVVLVGSLRAAIRRLNPAIPEKERAPIRPCRIVQIERGLSP